MNLQVVWNYLHNIKLNCLKQNLNNKNLSLSCFHKTWEILQKITVGWLFKRKANHNWLQDRKKQNKQNHWWLNYLIQILTFHKVQIIYYFIIIFSIKYKLYKKMEQIQKEVIGWYVESKYNRLQKKNAVQSNNSTL